MQAPAQRARRPADARRHRSVRLRPAASIAPPARHPNATQGDPGDAGHVRHTRVAPSRAAESVNAASPQLLPLGDGALLLRWPAQIDPAINDAVHACARRLRAGTPPPWLEALVPGYASLALLLDLDAFTGPGAPLDIARAWLEQRLQQPDDGSAAAPPRTVEIAVRYGGDDGPDLDAVAAATGLDAAEVVARHCAVDYRVALIGFAPGFPYLLGLDPALAVPRHATPRTLVPAGSVAIGGAQTGIYPQAGPGGWQLIGRTRTALFDPSAEPPTLLAPGDRLRFVPERDR